MPSCKTRRAASDKKGPRCGPFSLDITVSWHVYLIECEDGSIYTGIAVDVAKRYAVHCAGKGAKYTRSRKPRQLLASFPVADRSTALKAEHAIKKLTPEDKRRLANGDQPQCCSVALQTAPAVL